MCSPTWNAVLVGDIYMEKRGQKSVKIRGQLRGWYKCRKLPSIEFDQTWFMPYTYFGPSLVKPFPDKSCHELFAEANLQSSRVIGSHKRKKENYPGRINTKITYVSRTKTALRHARDSDSKVLHLGIKDNCIQMDTVTMHI